MKMDYQLEYNFSHGFLQLSTDYKLLWELIKSGHRIPAWMASASENEESIWELIEVIDGWGEPNNYSEKSLISYEEAKSFKFFESLCRSNSLHFICP